MDSREFFLFLIYRRYWLLCTHRAKSRPTRRRRSPVFCYFVVFLQINDISCLLRALLMTVEEVGSTALLVVWGTEVSYIYC